MQPSPNPDGSLALADPITITCRVCARALPLEMMAGHKRGRYGRDTICIECKRAAAHERRAARRAEGLCLYTTGCQAPAAPGRGGYCAMHAAEYAARKAAAAAARKETGLCIVSGCPERAAPGRSKCASHLAADAAAYAANPEKARARSRARAARLSARTTAEIKADRQRLRPDGVKQCRACRKSLDLAEFYEDRTKTDGLKDSCRRCGAESDARRRSEGWSRRLASWEERGLYACAYCDAPFEETEHVVARTAEDSPGDVDLNTVPSCWRCNRGPGGKFATPVDEWLDRLAAAGDPRGVARAVWESWPRVYLAALEDGTVVDVATGEVVEEVVA